MAQQPKIQVKFEAKGSQALRQAILQLAKAQGILERDMKKVKGATNELNNAQEKYRHRVKSNTDALGKQAEITKKLQGFIAKYRNQLLLAAFAANTFKNTIGKLTDLYAAQETAEKKLSTALGKTSQELLDYASALQRVTTYGDEVTIQAMSQTAAFTNNETAIKAIAAAAQDMASARGMDLITTTDLITKSIFSSTNALSRYGIEIDNSAEGADRLRAVIDALNSKFGGQAAAEVDTYAGAVTQMGNNWGDLGEKLGKSLGEALLPLIQGLNALAVALQKLPLEFIMKTMVSLAIATLATSKRMLRLRTSINKAVVAMKNGTTAANKMKVAFGGLKKAAKIFVLFEVASWAMGKLSDMFSGTSDEADNLTNSLDLTSVVFDRYAQKLKDIDGDYDAMRAQVSVFESDIEQGNDMLSLINKLTKGTKEYRDFRQSLTKIYGSSKQKATMESEELQFLVFSEMTLGQMVDQGGKLNAQQWERIQLGLQEKATYAEMVSVLNNALTNFAALYKEGEEDIKDWNQTMTELLEDIKKIEDAASDYHTDLIDAIKKETKFAELNLKYKDAELEFQKLKYEAEIRLQEIYGSSIALSDEQEKTIKKQLDSKYKALKAEKEHKDSIQLLNALTKKYTNTAKSEYSQLADKQTELKNKIEDIKKANQAWADDDTYKNLNNSLIIINKQMGKLEKKGLGSNLANDSKETENLWKEIDKLVDSTTTQKDKNEALKTSFESLKTTVQSFGGDVSLIDQALGILGTDIDVSAYDDIIELSEQYRGSASKTIEEIKEHKKSIQEKLNTINDEIETLNKLGNKTDEQTRKLNFFTIIQNKLTKAIEGANKELDDQEYTFQEMKDAVAALETELTFVSQASKLYQEITEDGVELNDTQKTELEGLIETYLENKKAIDDNAEAMSKYVSIVDSLNNVSEFEQRKADLALLKEQQNNLAALNITLKEHQSNVQLAEDALVTFAEAQINSILAPDSAEALAIQNTIDMLGEMKEHFKDNTDMVNKLDDAINKLTKDLNEEGNAWMEFGKEGMQRFTDDFTSMMSNAENLSQISLKNLRLAWEKTLQDMVAKMITSGIIRLIGLIIGSFSGDAKAGWQAGAKLSQTMGYYHEGGNVKKYHSGGMIPSYHQGGGIEEVPIMAQEGEFVMQRSAVDSIGLENLNKMNQSGQPSGSVNINFTGNVLDRNYIERKAIPMIKNAIKRGHKI